MIEINGIKINPTIFPDNTSQIWKLNTEMLINSKLVIIKWDFEDDKEIFYIAQLGELLKRYNIKAILEVDYLPYARQDKSINNTETFAIHVFAKILNECEFKEIRCIDVHSNVAKELIPLLYSSPPYSLNDRLQKFKWIVFPDSGAYLRYRSIETSSFHEIIIFHKNRDINGIIVPIPPIEKIIPEDYLIVDDICDGGKTFIMVANYLYNRGAKNVHLFVTHGIFSNGIDVLKEAGIKSVYTEKGVVYE